MPDDAWTGFLLNVVAIDWREYSTLTLDVSLSGAEDARISVHLVDGIQSGISHSAFDWQGAGHIGSGHGEIRVRERKPC